MNVEYLKEDKRTQLIQVVNSLTRDCITSETATKLIAKLVQASEPVELDFNSQVEGIKELVRMNYLPSEEAVSFIKRLAENELLKVKVDGRKTRGPQKERKGHRGKNDGPSVTRFKHGELLEAIIGSIQRGNKTRQVIVGYIANRFGYDPKSIRNTVEARLSGLVKEERLSCDDEGRYSVLEFASKEQAGIKDFTSRKEIEASAT